MAGLDVVCLISGGKDSFFSILHCIANGHRIVALANLHPPHHDGATIEDLDSYMYQTVGHRIIPLYERALGLPLYRQEIAGGAVNRDKCYGTPGTSANVSLDETEALVPLLQRVQQAHPNINAVSTGAILSDYQRTRVESVALRLGLTPLSYLWQWPRLPPHAPASLLEDMAAVGQDSRIVKVASGGLDDSLLWENVADARTRNRLGKIAARFGTLEDGAVLGEGGEYETLAISGPAPLWKGRIVVDEAARHVVAGEAGSASLLINDARVEMMEHRLPSSQLRIPSLLDQSFSSLLSKLRDSTAASGSYLKDDLDTSLPRAQGHLLIPNVVGQGANAAEQMESIMATIAQHIKTAAHSMTDIAYTSIILRSMSDFPAINAVYGAFFTRPNPPARVTIACADVLPAGKHLMVSATSMPTSSATSRQGLHVQSRSYWAPANIGPYSQAIAITTRAEAGDESARLVYIAGQIPLVPASMELPSLQTLSEVEASLAAKDVEDADERLFELQSVLSLQHTARVGRVMGVRSWCPGIAFVTASSAQDARMKATIARRAWNEHHHAAGLQQKDTTALDGSDDESFDVWHLRQGQGRNFLHQESHGSDPTAATTRGAAPALAVVRVDALPRGVSIEWVTYGRAGPAPTPLTSPHFWHLLEVFKTAIVC